MDFYKPQAIFFGQEGEISVFQNLIKIDISEYLLLMQYLAWFAPLVVVLQVDLPPALFWECGCLCRVQSASQLRGDYDGERVEGFCSLPEFTDQV